MNNISTADVFVSTSETKNIDYIVEKSSWQQEKVNSIILKVNHNKVESSGESSIVSIFCLAKECVITLLGRCFLCGLLSFCEPFGKFHNAGKCSGLSRPQLGSSEQQKCMQI